MFADVKKDHHIHKIFLNMIFEKAYFDTASKNLTCFNLFEKQKDGEVF